MVESINQSDSKYFSSVLSAWYGMHQRSLPWRKTSDPYRIWISEIILQQTRVAQGYDYYVRFVLRFPDVQSLASASEDEVLKYWEGLGYYSRARNLHSAAKTIVNQYNGEFPKTYPEVLALKGVGEYTAAAIVSFAYELPYAVLDGNVFRVLARLFAVATPIDTTDGKKQFRALADALLDANRTALHNQAIMEFGALQCVPVNPDCTVCPLETKCLAKANNLVTKLPIKQGKTRVQNRYLNYLDVRCGEQILIRKRVEDDIWKNLYEFPLIETATAVEPTDLVQTDAFTELFSGTTIRQIQYGAKEWKHVLSHRVVFARFHRVEVDSLTAFVEKFQPIAQTELSEYAFSRLVNRYLEVTQP